jgi:AcrR family transcriptional regulator
MRRIRLDPSIVKNERSFYDQLMPRVTPEHSAARRQQILDAARSCFLRDGFHQTSMLDIQREAGLSAGAVYLYFKSKKEIILGIAAQILATVGGIIPEEPVLDGKVVDLPGILRHFLARAETLHREQNLFPMAIQVWAEAIRDPAMLASLQANMAGVKARARHLIEICQERGLVDPAADPVEVTMAIVGLAQGYIVQRTLFDETVLEHYVAGVEALLLNATQLSSPGQAELAGSTTESA